MNIFLRAKHWQLFLVIYGLPILIQILAIAGLISVDAPILPYLFWDLVFITILTLSLGVILSWMGSVSLRLQEKLPQGMQMKVGLFKAFLIFPLLCILVFAVINLKILFAPVFCQVGTGFDPMAMGIIFPMQIFAMFCMIPTIWFTAKTIKSVDLQREAKFRDFSREFFLIFFYILGVWLIQPKVNRLSETTEKDA